MDEHWPCKPVAGVGGREAERFMRSLSNVYCVGAEDEGQNTRPQTRWARKKCFRNHTPVQVWALTEIWCHAVLEIMVHDVWESIWSEAESASHLTFCLLAVSLLTCSWGLKGTFLLPAITHLHHLPDFTPSHFTDHLPYCFHPVVTPRVILLSPVRKFNSL